MHASSALYALEHEGSARARRGPQVFTCDLISEAERAFSTVCVFENNITVIESEMMGLTGNSTQNKPEHFVRVAAL